MSVHAPSGRRGLLVLLLAILLVLATGAYAAGCGGEEQAPTTSAPGATAPAARSDLILASTTSTQDSGLFEVLIPAFEAAHPYTVKVIAVGSGEALKLGESGDADVLLVHSPASEETFMEAGFGSERKAVMYNDFVVVGPPADPAGIKGATDVAAALKAIAAAEATFFSRGDESGTHRKELNLWSKAAMKPEGAWYQTTGQGMGETLTIADQSGGYTLADRATYLSKSGSLALEILVEGDTALFNQYHVITCAKGVNKQGAADFMDWIVSDEAQQRLIASYGAEKYGQPLFVPNAGLAD